MDWLGTLFLYLHVGGVIVAFGPTIAFPFIAAKAANEPQHGNFALRTSEWITEKVVEPGSIFVFLMGVGLIVTRGYNPLETLWVGVSIVLFLITFAFANLVQLPTIRKMVAMTSQPPPPEAAASGPPPAFVALATKAERGGKFMTLMLFVILALMIVKPF